MFLTPVGSVMFSSLMLREALLIFVIDLLMFLQTTLLLVLFCIVFVVALLWFLDVIMVDVLVVALCTVVLPALCVVPDMPAPARTVDRTSSPTTTNIIFFFFIFSSLSLLVVRLSLILKK